MIRFRCRRHALLALSFCLPPLCSLVTFPLPLDAFRSLTRESIPALSFRSTAQLPSAAAMPTKRPASDVTKVSPSKPLRSTRLDVNNRNLNSSTADGEHPRPKRRSITARAHASRIDSNQGCLRLLGRCRGCALQAACGQLENDCRVYANLELNRGVSSCSNCLLGGRPCLSDPQERTTHFALSAPNAPDNLLQTHWNEMGMVMMSQPQSAPSLAPNMASTSAWLQWPQQSLVSSLQATTPYLSFTSEEQPSYLPGVPYQYTQPQQPFMNAMPYHQDFIDASGGSGPPLEDTTPSANLLDYYLRPDGPGSPEFLHVMSDHLHLEKINDLTPCAGSPQNVPCQLLSAPGRYSQEQTGNFMQSPLGSSGGWQQHNVTQCFPPTPPLMNDEPARQHTCLQDGSSTGQEASSAVELAYYNIRIDEYGFATVRREGSACQLTDMLSRFGDVKLRDLISPNSEFNIDRAQACQQQDVNAEASPARLLDSQSISTSAAAKPSRHDSLSS